MNVLKNSASLVVLCMLSACVDPPSPGTVDVDQGVKKADMAPGDMTSVDMAPVDMAPVDMARDASGEDMASELDLGEPVDLQGGCDQVNAANTLDDVDFVTTWTVGAGGTITIPVAQGSTYDFHVDWDNDGMFDECNLAEDRTHTYPVEGLRTVRIRGVFTHFELMPAALNESHRENAAQLTGVVQWGNGRVWSSMARMFYGASSLTDLPEDAPDLSNVTDMALTFSDASAFNQNIDTWNVASVRSMQSMFSGASSFNQNIDTWNVSNVTNLGSTFFGASSFNQPLNSWDVFSVTNMGNMFNGASAFNQDLSGWLTGNVLSLFGMFNDAKSFNKDIGSWNTAKVENMRNVFNGASAFNQDLSGWDTSRVTSMAGMFANAGSFDQDLSAWSYESVSDMERAFNNSKLSITNYDALLDALDTSGLMGITLGAQGLEYCNDEARNRLTGEKVWMIEGDSMAESGCP